MTVYYLKWIWNSIASIRGGFALAIAFMLAETSSDIGTTYLQKFVIDNVFLRGQYGLLPLYLSLFALAFVVNSAFMTISPYKYVHNEYRMDDILLLRMLRRLFRVPMAKIQNERSARYVQYITDDLYTGGTMIGYHSPIGVQRVLYVLALMFIVGWSSWPILLTVTALSAAYIAAGQYFGKRIKAVNRQIQDNRTSLAVHLEESISATREVIAYHREGWESRIYHALYQKYYDSVIQGTKTTNRQLLFSDPLRYAITLAVLGFGGYQLFEGQLSLGAFVIVFQFSNQLMDSYQRLFQYAMDFSGMLTSIDRMDLLLKEEQDAEGEAALADPIRSIHFRQVDFTYPNTDQPVLRDLNLEIPCGRKVAFVGASGGGKSTIAQLLTRFYEPTSGQILVNGAPLGRYRREDWSGRVRIVFQDPYLMADSIRSNLSFGRDWLSEGEMEEASRSAQLWSDIERLPNRMEEEIGERGVQLSGGQKQRLAIARSIADHPEVLIFDEATSSLDLETERLLQARLDELRDGKTTIIIAHRLSTVRNADLIYVMDEGRVAEQGTHDELMRSGRIYASLVAAQSQV